MDIGTGNRTAYRLLLVEDDFVISSEMKRHLEKWGYEVNCVQDFGNVLAEFAACSPHLVLMDIGTALLQRLLLVLPDTPDFPGAHHLRLLRRRQHEHRHGHEHGRGRFSHQALRTGSAVGQSTGHAAPHLRLPGPDQPHGVPGPEKVC